MKQSLLVILMAIASFLYSQDYTIEVKAINESFSVGNKDAFSVVVYEADVKTVTKAWKKLMKDFDSKAKGKEELFADDAMIKNMSENSCDIYTKVIEKDKTTTELICGIDLGGVFLSKSIHADKYPVIETILKDFAIELTKDGVKERKEKQEDVLSDLEKDLKKLQSNKADLEEEIEDYRKKIRDNEEAIKTNIDDQATKKKEIEVQKAVVKKLEETEQTVK